MKPLTGRRLSLLCFLVRYFEDNGRWPSHRSIGAAVGLASTNSVSAQLVALVRLGYLRDTGDSRWPYAIACLPDGTPVVPRLIPSGPRPDGSTPEDLWSVA